MAIHRDISSDLRGAVARVAMAAISEARGQQTAPNGTVSVRNADGTRTVIGAGAGTDGTGAPVGVRQFVGDTTPPGRPTGLSWSSSAGDVTGRWDGTLEGGVPADLDYVELRAGDEVVGRLRRAGSCSMRAKDGTELSCVAVAVDVSGNASAESEATAVTVRDLVAEASGDASKALEEARKTGQMAVTATRVEYAATQSPTEPPGEGAEWSAAPPAPAGGAYTWMRTTATYGDGRSETSEPVRVTGEAGADGAGVSSSSVSYAVGASGTERPPSGWSEEVPKVPRGSWLWTRTETAWTDGSTTASYSVSRSGEDAVAVELSCDTGCVLRNATGTVTVSATVASGGQRASNVARLRDMLGPSASLRWAELSADGSEREVPADDPRLSADGFSVTVSAQDVTGDKTLRCYVES